MGDRGRKTYTIKCLRCENVTKVEVYEKRDAINTTCKIKINSRRCGGKKVFVNDN